MSTAEEGAALVAYRALRVAAELRVGSGGPETALYLLVTGCNVPVSLAARAYGCSKQYVSRIMGEVEDRRDDATYEAAIADLERRIFEGAI
jgi:hypothetical protein